MQCTLPAHIGLPYATNQVLVQYELERRDDLRTYDMKQMQQAMLLVKLAS